MTPTTPTTMKRRLAILPALMLATLATAAGRPAGGVEVLEAIPFRCATGWTHHWSAERPEVTAGTILVAKVDPEAIRPRASAGPVLMVGEEIAEIVNPGQAEGIVIAVVPAPAAWSPREIPTLAGREVFLSVPGLPDTIDTAERRTRREAAKAAGVAPQAAGGRVPARNFADRDALERELASIVRTRCPDQSRLADLLDGSAADPVARPATR